MVEFWVALSDVIVIVRRFVREGWTRYPVGRDGPHGDRDLLAEPLRKFPAKCPTAFARRRSGIRIPSDPLQKYAILQVKHEPRMSAPIAGQVLVQQPCSNAEGSLQR